MQAHDQTEEHQRKEIKVENTENAQPNLLHLEHRASMGSFEKFMSSTFHWKPADNSKIEEAVPHDETAR